MPRLLVYSKREKKEERKQVGIELTSKRNGREMQIASECAVCVVLRTKTGEPYANVQGEGAENVAVH